MWLKNRFLFFPAFSLTTDERAGQEKDVEGRGRGRGEEGSGP